MTLSSERLARSASCSWREASIGSRSSSTKYSTIGALSLAAASNTSVSARYQETSSSSGMIASPLSPPCFFLPAVPPEALPELEPLFLYLFLFSAALAPPDDPPLPPPPPLPALPPPAEAPPPPPPHQPADRGCAVIPARAKTPAK